MNKWRTPAVMTLSSGRKIQGFREVLVDTVKNLSLANC
jgi:hypothetical protein